MFLTLLYSAGLKTISTKPFFWPVTKKCGLLVALFFTSHDEYSIFLAGHTAMLHTPEFAFEHTVALLINGIADKQAWLMDAGSPVLPNNSNLSANMPLTPSSSSILIAFFMMPFSLNDSCCMTSLR